MLRRRFISSAAAGLAAPALASAGTAQKFTLILDWFINPDHAPLFAAKYCGAFGRAGLDVKLIAPTDPDLPPRLVAAGQADACLELPAPALSAGGPGPARAPHRHAH